MFERIEKLLGPKVFKTVAVAFFVVWLLGKGAARVSGFILIISLIFWAFRFLGFDRETVLSVMVPAGLILLFCTDILVPKPKNPDK